MVNMKAAQSSRLIRLSEKNALFIHVISYPIIHEEFRRRAFIVAA